MRQVFLCVLVICLTGAVGCGGGSSAEPTRNSTPSKPAEVRGVEISPLAATVLFESTKQFKGTVDTNGNTGIAWSIEEGTVAGSINSNGLFTASRNPGTYHIIARSVIDQTKLAWATVTVVESVFTRVGTMKTERSEHQSILLPDGRVFIGCGANMGVIESVEVFDPSSGTFTSFPAARRNNCSSTLLPSGKILLAGGKDTDSIFSSADLFDPEAGVFTPTGSMLEPRSGHVATVLQDGRVLISGGSGSRFGGAEIYDPSSGTFSLAGNMNEKRSLHTATLLPNGKVLILGGSDTPTSGEIFDAEKGEFTTIATPRIGQGHTATSMLDGRILITGGAEIIPDWVDDLTAETQIYDAETGLFTAGPAMKAERAEHSATLQQDGKVLVVGGAVQGDAAAPFYYICAFGGAELYDPALNSFVPTSWLNDGRAGHSATLLKDGGVLVTGGHGCDVPPVPYLNISSAEVHY